MRENILISSCLLGLACRYDGNRVNKIDKETLDKLKEKYNIIPFCPEIYGGLPTPRIPSERRGDKVFTKDERDVTYEYGKGAQEALYICKLFEIKIAVLKERSPACGKGKIYDGTFTKTLIDGDGVTAEHLSKNGIRVLGESNILSLLK